MSKTKIEKRYFALTALIIFVPVLICFVLANYFIKTDQFSLSVEILIYTIFSIILAIIITAGFAIFNPAVADAMFTLRRLLRFESLSNPLLLKLTIYAPGTYHHSLNLSNLAQRACKAVGADSLLVRTASYYHDIGKLIEPAQFIENQAESEIPETESAEHIRKTANKIIAHVAQGVKIAKENHMPEEMIDIIAEHHGTTRAWYFYKQAVERGLKLKKTDFKYPGPIPQSRESAILMICDCIEAAVRAEQILDKNKIIEIVNSIVSERKSEGQLKNSNLSETEIEKVKKSIIDTLMSIYHQRIKY